MTDNTQLSGILPVKKPQGWTSFDVIGKLRGVTRIKRLGHGGTLDPMAEGVLPVFVGKATKCCDILPDKRKEYKAGFKFGLTSDTEDITGKILTECEAPVTLAQIEEILPQFVGDIMQLPPMYSAVKVGGKKLYQLAREGKTAERTPRKARVYGIKITAYDEAAREGSFDIDCGQGTYVRTVIADMGVKLGAGGVMTSLVRTRSNGITLDKCLTIDEIAEICAEGRLEEILMPVDKAFEIYPEATLHKWETSLYKNGVKLRPEQVCCADKSDESAIYRVYGFDGSFLGTGHFVGGEFRSHKNFF